MEDDAPATTPDPGEDRDRTAADRDQRAEAHDDESDARDQRADARDDRAEAREIASGGIDQGSAADRAGARRDRLGGASDRTQAADDREAASADRISSAQERATASIDALTGAYRRDVGLTALEREISRAQRTGGPLTLAFVDVDHLKRTNDGHGHAAGDDLLRRVVSTIRAQLREYDLIVRVGGDEFLCALTDVDGAETAARLTTVNAQLGAMDPAGSISFGSSELRPGDVLEDLVARADDAMYAERESARGSAA